MPWRGRGRVRGKMERKQSEGEEDVSVLFEAQSKGEVDKEKDSREDMVSK